MVFTAPAVRQRTSSQSSSWLNLSLTTPRLVGVFLLFMLGNFVIASIIIARIDREQHEDGGNGGTFAIMTQLVSASKSMKGSLQRMGVAPIIQTPVLANNHRSDGLDESSLPLVRMLPESLSADWPSQVVDGVNVTQLQSEIRDALTQIRRLSARLSSRVTPSLAQSQADQFESLESFSSETFLPWLIIGIPTVARPNPNSYWYLNATLHSVLAQLPIDPTDPFYNQIHVVVMSHQSPEQGPHEQFEKLKLELSHRREFHFLYNSNKLVDDNPSLRDAGNANVPGWKVRKQTRDVAATLRSAIGKSRYYLVMEDDFTLCPHFIRQVHAMVDKAYHYHQQWFSLKFSFGMNGYLIHNTNGDSQHLYDYLLRKHRLRPPDHLMVEWSAGEKESVEYKRSRPHCVYRYNLLYHLGSVSSLRAELSPEYPPCFHELNTEIVFEVESFRMNECAHDDLWPCPSVAQIEAGHDVQSRSQWYPPPFNIPDAVINEAQKK